MAEKQAGSGRRELSVPVDAAMLRMLERLAERDGKTRDEVVQAAIREYVARNAVSTDEPLPPPKGG